MTRALSGAVRQLMYFPMDLRGGLLRWFTDQHVGARDIWGRFAQRQGYGIVEDYLRGLDARFGTGAAVATRARMDDYWTMLCAEVASAQQASPDALHRVRLSKAHQLALHAMPDSDFAVALEAASQLAVEGMAISDMGMPGWDYIGTVLEHVNDVLERRGVPYRMDRDLNCESVGDQAVHELAIEPALGALVDPRLAGARAEFEDAVAKLRRAGPRDLEDAIEESRKAVESTMKVLLAAHGVQVSPKLTTKPLHDALVDAGIVERQTDNLVTASARMANVGASHGSGATVRAVPADLAGAAVAAAGVAVTLLAARLP